MGGKKIKLFVFSKNDQPSNDRLIFYKKSNFEFSVGININGVPFVSQKVNMFGSVRILN